MLGKAEGPNGYINTYWSAWYEFVSQELERNPGISHKAAKRTATQKLDKHVKSYNPLFFSENSEQGKIHIYEFRKRLNSKFESLLDKQLSTYEYKRRKFWHDINSNASRFDYK